MPHSDRSISPSQGTFDDLPPFPDTVPTAPLLRISLGKLLNHDAHEEERCWKACCDLGFFYLDLTDSKPTYVGSSASSLIAQSRPDDVHFDGQDLLQDANQLFEVMKGFFELDVDEKIKYDFADQGSYFGYKGYGAGVVDKVGTKDKNEFYNISKDDILELSERISSPDVLNSHRELYASYIRSSHKICLLVTSLLSSRLPLYPNVKTNGGLPALHDIHTRSGDQIRFVKAPPQGPDTQTKATVALGEHTDFGSVTVLFNRLGGLQVRLPGHISAIPPSQEQCLEEADPLCENGWTYVRPLPGHCIINLGDAIVKFSDGKLRSNIHRVVAAPGEQRSVTRYSLVYFCRPGDSVVLKSLVDTAENKDGVEEEPEGVTAKEWILRRALGRRKVDGWVESGGTEEVSMRRGGGSRRG